MNTRPYRTRVARTRPVTDAEYAALCQCACRRLLPRRPHSVFECTPTAQETGTGAAS
ncbi:MAG TPA: hypothetical protein VF892_01640 [Pseudonocardiaceae bacterium]